MKQARAKDSPTPAKVRRQGNPALTSDSSGRGRAGEKLQAICRSILPVFQGEDENNIFLRARPGNASEWSVLGICVENTSRALSFHRDVLSACW